MNAASPGELLRMAMQSARSVLLTGPMFPDGDSIGACLALARAIEHLSSARVDVAGAIPLRYAWMPGADSILADEAVAADYDLVVVLDGDCRRLPPPVEAAFHAATMRGIIDHHSSTGPEDYDIALIDASAASTCEMVYELLIRWGIAVDVDLSKRGRGIDGDLSTAAVPVRDGAAVNGNPMLSEATGDRDGTR